MVAMLVVLCDTHVLPVVLAVLPTAVVAVAVMTAAVATQVGFPAMAAATIVARAKNHSNVNNHNAAGLDIRRSSGKTNSGLVSAAAM